MIWRARQDVNLRPPAWKARMLTTKHSGVSRLRALPCQGDIPVFSRSGAATRPGCDRGWAGQAVLFLEHSGLHLYDQRSEDEPDDQRSDDEPGAGECSYVHAGAMPPIPRAMLFELRNSVQGIECNDSFTPDPVH